MTSSTITQQAINKVARDHWGRILASLVKSLNDIQLAEDCLQDAIISALNHWQKNGLPSSPEAWLITTARRKAIDRIRRDKNFASKLPDLAYLIKLDNSDLDNENISPLQDKRLELIFTCCHPALDRKTQVALTLRTLCGLTTEEVAKAFLDKPDALAQRLVRAKKKILLANIPYKIPKTEALPERLAAVLNVIYLIFNEGYTASAGHELVKENLTHEAIRLARTIASLMTNEPEIMGLLALMLLHDSRSASRSTKTGDLISLEDQDRTKWDHEKIIEGTTLIKSALPMGKIGTYQLQAAISAIHAESPSWQDTDWPQICALYKLLYEIQPTAIIKINHAMALSYAQSETLALEMLEEVETDRKIKNYQPFYAAKADLLTRTNDKIGAITAFEKAIALTQNEKEKAFLNRKLSTLKS